MHTVENNAVVRLFTPLLECTSRTLELLSLDVALVNFAGTAMLIANLYLVSSIGRTVVLLASALGKLCK